MHDLRPVMRTFGIVSKQCQARESTRNSPSVRVTGLLMVADASCAVDVVGETAVEDFLE